MIRSVVRDEPEKMLVPLTSRGLGPASGRIPQYGKVLDPSSLFPVVKY